MRMCPSNTAYSRNFENLKPELKSWAQKYIQFQTGLLVFGFKNSCWCFKRLLQFEFRFQPHTCVHLNPNTNNNSTEQPSLTLHGLTTNCCHFHMKTQLKSRIRQWKTSSNITTWPPSKSKTRHNNVPNKQQIPLVSSTLQFNNNNWSLCKIPLLIMIENKWNDWKQTNLHPKNFWSSWLNHCTSYYNITTQNNLNFQHLFE